VITLQIADPSSRQRGRPTETGPQISDSNIPTGSNIWSKVPQGCSIPRHTDWLTVSRKVTSTSTVEHNFWEIESVSVFRWEEGDTYSVGSLLLVQWLRLALSKRPIREGVSLPSHEAGNRSLLRNAVFFSSLQFRMVGKVLKPSDFECYTPSSEPYTFYLNDPCSSLNRNRNFLHKMNFWPAVRSTKPLVQLVPRATCTWVKLTERYINHSFPFQRCRIRGSFPLSPDALSWCCSTYEISYLFCKNHISLTPALFDSVSLHGRL
jgi:hypothetical protein